jgi:LCP family protein required for cell wall assembly
VTAAVAVVGLGAAAAVGSGLDRWAEPISPPNVRSTEEALPTPIPGEPLTILVAGLDVRSLEKRTEADGGLPRADAIMLVHVSANRDRVDVVSLPRDLHVEGLKCSRLDGSHVETVGTRLNLAMIELGANAGPAETAACLVRAVETVTEVRVDNYVITSYESIASLVDQLGGVEVCLAEPARWPDLGVDIPSGTSTISGDTATAFSRARKGNGLSGSDLDRVTRQQQIVEAIARRVMDSEALTNPATVMGLASWLVTETQTDFAAKDLDHVVQLAFSLRAIEASDITLTTVPVRPHSENPNALVLDDDAASVFQALQTDSALPTVTSSTPTTTSGRC